MAKTIILAAGGTGGHLSPALAMADILNKKGYKTIIYSDQRCKSYLASDHQYNIKNLYAHPYNCKNPVKLCLFILSLIKNTLIISYNIFKIKADLVISFGGYTSLSSNIAALICNKKLILHEQNSVLGRQNKIFVKFADHIAYSFPNTKALDNIAENKKILTGIPVRHSFFNKNNNISSQHNGKFNILIIGGSQGAQFLGDKITKAFQKLDKNILSNLHITQQIKHNQHDKAESLYKALRVSHELKRYFHDISDKFAHADLIISRAGAGTISEIIYAQKIAILIPYPFAKDDHQFFNAKYLCDKEAALMLAERDFSEENFINIIRKLFSERQYRDKISNNLSNLADFSNYQKFLELIESSLQQS